MAADLEFVGRYALLLIGMILCSGRRSPVRRRVGAGTAKVRSVRHCGRWQNGLEPGTARRTRQ